MASTNIGETRLAQGRVDEAEEPLVEALSVSRASGDRSTVAFVSGLLGAIAAVRGDGDAFEAHFARAREAVGEGSHSDHLTIDLRQAEALVTLDRGEEALVITERALVAARAAGVGGLVMAGLTRARGLAMASTGSAREAERELRASLESARSHGSLLDVAWALQALAGLSRGGGVELEEDLVEEWGRLRGRLVVAEPTTPG